MSVLVCACWAYHNAFVYIVLGMYVAVRVICRSWYTVELMELW